MSYIEILVATLVLGIIIVPITISMTDNNISTAESIGYEKAVYISKAKITSRLTGQEFVDDTEYTVEVSDEVTVSLATNHLGEVISTADDIVLAINNDSEIAKKIVAANADGDNGSGVVTELDYINLENGNASTAALKTIICTGDNNDIVVTATSPGIIGNEINIRFIKPSDPNQAISISNLIKAKTTWKIAGKKYEYVLYGGSPIVDYN